MNELEKYFVYKCEKGLAERGLSTKKTYQERLDFEIQTILRMGYPGYFLIVQDFIKWAKSNDIYVGPGRGSAAGSLASYCLGITELDPIRWDLLFERFLNPARVSMPDIDVDFEKRYRDRVIEYVEQRYGKDRVAHIGTFGRMKAKSAVRHVTKTLGHPFQIGDELSKLLLEPIHGKPQPLKTSIEKVEELNVYRKGNTTQGEVLRWAEKVENLISNAGVHASGIIIAEQSLRDTVPMFKGRGGEQTTQWEMYNVEDAGHIKFDFLGLDALTKIHRCVDLIKERHGVEVDINSIDLDDRQVFERLRAGDNIGIFQLEASSGMRDLLIQIRPTSVEDLIALVAIYRPGPLESDYKDIYLGVRAGTEVPSYLDPALEPLLSNTAGWIIYQEQVLAIAKELAGYSLSEADLLRRAIGKKKQKEMDKHEQQFKDGWCANGLDPKKADILWDQIVAFANYAFNRSHAAAYAFITYQTAWLKTHYPVEFMTAVMVSEQDDQDDIIKCIADCKRLGIDILPPDINKSGKSFTIDEDGGIRFGLAPVKNLGQGPVEAVITERNEDGRFKSLRDFCERVDLGTINRLKLESLIRTGAFDAFGHNRASMIGAVENIWEYRKQKKSYNKKMETYAKKMDAYEQRIIDVAEEKLSEKGKKLGLLKEPARPPMPHWPEMPDIDEFSIIEIEQNEHELLGFYVSSHPLDNLSRTNYASQLNTIEDAKQMPNGTKVSIGCVITSMKEHTTRAKKKMAFLRLEDLTGSSEAVVFSFMYNRVKDLLGEIRPLKIDGQVEVTEADDYKVSKIKISDVTILNLQAHQRSEKVEATVNVLRVKELLDLIEKYSGDKHEVSITLLGHDGTRMRLQGNHHIGNYRGAFMRELTRINNAQ